MRKEQLIQAILKTVKKRGVSTAPLKSAAEPNSAKTLKSKSKPGKSTRKPKRATTVGSQDQARNDEIRAKIIESNERREELKNLALAASLSKENRTINKDRLVLIVRDSHWLQAYWEITDASIRRAKAALDKNWRGARPVLQLYQIVDEGDGVNENLIREIDVHGGVDTWYIDTQAPASTFRIAIGYASAGGRFFCVAKSNKVTTPSLGKSVTQDHWADIANNYESYFAMSGGYSDSVEAQDLQDVFEEKLGRPIKPFSGVHSCIAQQRNEFKFEVDAQIVVYGVAEPGAIVSIGGDMVRVEDNGTFSIRLDFPDKRQVLPVVCCSRDGAHQRTTVLAVERNTKVMEDLNPDADD